MPERFNIYGLLFIGGILLTAWMWSRMTKREDHAHDGRLTIIYFAGLFGALVGAKLAFLFAEGWFYRDNFIALLTGRSVTGALLGGYAAVEVAKWKLKYPRTTGDFFAVLVPLALAIGRIGCLVQGCCLGEECSADAWYAMHDHEGIARWPSAIAEMTFNVLFLAWTLLAMRFHWFTGNRFHLYLIAYGTFRFFHEFARERIELVAVGDVAFGGYHFIALAMVAFGGLRFVQRCKQHETPHAMPR